MFNIFVIVGVGMMAIVVNKMVELDQLVKVKVIFLVVGNVVEVLENLMDVVMGVFGLGLVYVVLMIEVLVDGGVLVGLFRAIV